MINLKDIHIFTSNLIKNDSTGLEETVKVLATSVRAAVMNGVRGGVAEFGTMTGRTAIALATSCKFYFSYYKKNDVRHGYKEERFLHLFDSFEGLPAANDQSDLINIHVRSGIWSGGTCKGLSAEELGQLITQLGADSFTSIFSGWFKDTIKKIPINMNYSVVHIDCDLYQSTMDALTVLFDRHQISKGAHILFDDYNCAESSRDVGERKAWQELCHKFRIDTELLGYYSVSGARFLVHSYENTAQPE